MLDDNDILFPGVHVLVPVQKVGVVTVGSAQSLFTRLAGSSGLTLMNLPRPFNRD